jgi:hypothetical protein
MGAFVRAVIAGFDAIDKSFVWHISFLCCPKTSTSAGTQTRRCGTILLMGVDPRLGFRSAEQVKTPEELSKMGLGFSKGSDL